MSRATDILRRLARRPRHEHDYTLVYGLRGYVDVCKCGDRIIYGRAAAVPVEETT